MVSAQRYSQSLVTPVTIITVLALLIAGPTRSTAKPSTRATPRRHDGFNMGPLAQTLHAHLARVASCLALNSDEGCAAQCN